MGEGPADRMKQIAGVGGWEIDLKKGKVDCTEGLMGILRITSADQPYARVFGSSTCTRTIGSALSGNLPLREAGSTPILSNIGSSGGAAGIDGHQTRGFRARRARPTEISALSAPSWTLQSARLPKSSCDKVRSWRSSAS